MTDHNRYPLSYDSYLKQYEGLKVVVTGGAGFIGSHLVEKLLTLGAEVSVVDNFLNGNKIAHLAPNQNLHIYEADVTDNTSLIPIIKGKDIIFHLAAVVGIEETQSDPFEVLNVEIIGTLNILTLAVKNKVKRVIFASSSEVYGDSLQLMKEDDTLCPKSTYAVVKVVGEEYCNAFHKKYGLDYASLRYFNVYGPRQDKRFVISRFVDSALQNKPIVIYGDGSQTRDFTYIDDSVNMTLIAGQKQETKSQAINIAIGVPTSIKQLWEIIASSVARKRNPVPEYADYGGLRPRQIEVFNRTADTKKAQKVLKYKAQVSLETGIKKYIDWYKGSV